MAIFHYQNILQAMNKQKDVFPPAIKVPRFDVSELIFTRTPEANVSWKRTLSTLESLYRDTFAMLHGRTTGEFVLCNDKGQNKTGETFAFGDEEGHGYYFRIKDILVDSEGPEYHYFHFTTVGLDSLELSASIAHIDDMSLKIFAILDTITIRRCTLQNLAHDRQQIDDLIAKHLQQLGYYIRLS